MTTLPLPVPCHRLGENLGSQERTHEVQLEDRSEAVRIEVEERTTDRYRSLGLVPAGRVDEHVKASPSLDHRTPGILERLDVEHVGDKRTTRRTRSPGIRRAGSPGRSGARDATTSSTASGCLASTATLAPALRRPSAIARPSTPLPPVTMAARPDRSNIAGPTGR